MRGALWSCCRAPYETVDVRWMRWSGQATGKLLTERKIIQKCTACGTTRFVRTTFFDHGPPVLKWGGE